MINFGSASRMTAATIEAIINDIVDFVFLFGDIGKYYINRYSI